MAPAGSPLAPRRELGEVEFSSGWKPPRSCHPGEPQQVTAKSRRSSDGPQPTLPAAEHLWLPKQDRGG